MRRLYLGLCILLLSVGSGTGLAATAPDVTPAQAQRIIARRAKETLLTIKNKDWKALAAIVHPKRGVRFSPYGYVETKTDLVFSSREIPLLWGQRQKRRWGEYDGSGDPIRLTFPQYYRRFIYNKDFAKAKNIGYNQFLSTGNTLKNAAKVYPKALFVEYYIPGPPDHEVEWGSLCLVFEQVGKTWYLVGIVHDEWTI